MAPRNMPERKNRRRKSALARLLRYGPTGFLDNRLLEIEALERRIVRDASTVTSRKYGRPVVGVVRRRREPKQAAEGMS